MRSKLKKYCDKQHTFIGTLKKKGQHLLVLDVKDAANGEYIADHVWLSVRKRYYPKKIELMSQIKFTGTVKHYAHDYLIDPTLDDYGITRITKLCEYVGNGNKEVNLKDLLPKHVVWNPLDTQEKPISREIIKRPLYTEAYMTLRYAKTLETNI